MSIINERRNFWRVLCEYALSGIDKALTVQNLETKNHILFVTKKAAEEMIEEHKELVGIDRD